MDQQTNYYKNHKKIKCLRKQVDSRTFLIKCTSKNNLFAITEYDLHYMSENQIENTLINIEVLKTMRHPNLLETKAAYEAKSKTKFCVITNYVNGESLSDKIEGQKDQLFEEDQILDWFTQLCLATKYLHDRKMIIRNLCNKKIFVTSANIIKIQEMIKLDLSMHEDWHEIRYMAPERIKGETYNRKADVWTLGVILYKMCALSFPFEGKNLVYVTLSIVKGKYKPIPIGFSKELNDLVKDLLQIESENRPTIDAVLENPIIKERIERFSSENIKMLEESHAIAKKQKALEKNVNQLKNEKVIE